MDSEFDWYSLTGHYGEPAKLNFEIFVFSPSAGQHESRIHYLDRHSRETGWC